MGQGILGGFGDPKRSLMGIQLPELPLSQHSESIFKSLVGPYFYFCSVPGGFHMEGLLMASGTRKADT